MKYMSNIEKQTYRLRGRHGRGLQSCDFNSEELLIEDTIK
jgi:hypothetical protein